MRAYALMISLALFSGQASAQLFAEKPDILVCSVSSAAAEESWDQFVFYISGTRKNGEILYKSLTSNPVLISLDSSGRLTAPNLHDCHDKHVDELWEQGKAASFSTRK